MNLELPHLLLAFLAATIVHSGSSDEISDALDLESDWSWSFTQGNGFEVTPVEFDSGVGGTVLRVFVPAGESGFISTNNVDDPSVLRFRYQIETGEGPWSAGPYNSPSPILTSADKLGTWLEFESEHRESSTLKWDFESINVDRVVYLDEIDIFPGFRLERSFEGLALDVEPEREFYQVGEWVDVVAVADQGRSFLFWSDGPMHSSASRNPHWQGRLPSPDNGSMFHPVSGANIEIVGLAFVVEDGALDFSIHEESGEAQKVSLSGESGGFYFVTEESGYLSYQVRSAGESMDTTTSFREKHFFGWKEMEDGFRRVGFTR
ncbi:hypothetical protein VDG1235_1408 [Verrucomicrobiia bacterium DG1235]|nr:hypothetical protein VDG1235_1408 [Verrucomicrobiae bacterium DG1235]